MSGVGVLRVAQNDSLKATATATARQRQRQEQRQTARATANGKSNGNCKSNPHLLNTADVGHPATRDVVYEKERSMNILLNIEKGVEAAAGDVLKFITKSQKVVASAGPGVVAGLGSLLGAVGTALTTGQGAVASGGLNLALDAETVAGLKTVWADLESFAASLGIKA
jgi:hypothetical protein